MLLLKTKSVKRVLQVYIPTSLIGTRDQTNGGLFDISKDVEKLSGREEIFYEDQKGDRQCRLSEEIDAEYEAERETRREKEAAESI